MATVEAITILLVEDDLADQKLLRMSLENQGISNQLCIAGSGEEAMDFLHRRRNYSSGTPQPDLILLDLNMPGMGGMEFLRQIKDDDALKQIPVIILTTSNSEKDIRDSYKLQASGYVSKPATLGELRRLMGEVEEYWFTVCKRLPKESGEHWKQSNR